MAGVVRDSAFIRHLTSAITSGWLPPLRRYSVTKVFTGLVTPSLAPLALAESTL